jgi:acetyl-CoA carboxylase biotin carboxyl carrier protein
MKLEILNIENLREIVKIAKDEGVTELKVESKDFKISVNFATTHAQIHHAQPIIHQSSTVHSETVTSKVPAAESGFHVIKSPFVGTFYSSPSPSKPVYVKVGDKVKVGQPLCVLEAMKIMNEIDSDINGEIVEICVDNESLVEYAQPLFKIKA